MDELDVLLGRTGERHVSSGKGLAKIMEGAIRSKEVGGPVCGMRQPFTDI